ncbi:hypothetical protein DFH27DRAFT_515936 [Peziza echinospora]|nr:hypothetical protein DFH27DRAFT_515936 [Peziza echinospora]
MSYRDLSQVSPSQTSASGSQNPHSHHHQQHQQQQQQQQQQQAHSVASSSSSPQPASGGPPQIHKRTYQACIPCRQRKVRCDLGSVEAPHPPPCVRCRRESKECFFSVTRRKTRSSSAAVIGRGGARAAGAVRKRQKVEEAAVGPAPYRASVLAAPATGGDAEAAARNSYRPPPQPLHDTHQHQQAASASRTRLLQGEVYNSHDALHLLFEAAGRGASAPLSPKPKSENDDDDDGCDDEEDDDEEDTEEPERVDDDQPMADAFTDQAAAANARQPPHPTLGGYPGKYDDIDNSIHPLGRRKSRFVKSGWFTAREAIGYVDYFFTHHHPLSPLLTTSYAIHSTHPALLQNEPFLATTLLAIASRYLNLPGPGGHSRSYAIHDMLWRELRRGLESVIWGGGGGGPPSRGGLGGIGSSQGKGLRTLGTVEALMVLTEWHVRNLHFPVGGEGGWGAFDGLYGNDPDEDDNDAGSIAGEGSVHRRRAGGLPGRRARGRGNRGVVEGLGDRIENILEPAWRSDRMSWMLLGNALTLSYELGVFDDLDEPISSVSTPQSVATPSPSTHAGHPPTPYVPPATAYRLRCRRIQRLLVVYVTQLASRLGWTSMIPKHITDALGYKGQYPNNISAGVAIINRTPTDLQDTVFQCWTDLTMLMKYCGEHCFPSRVGTRDLMRSGRYVLLLENLRPLLRSWKEGFEAFGFPTPIHNILTLEYEHVRMYVNSLALQAIIDRCTTTTPSFAAMMGANRNDLSFLSDVIDASRCVLTTVVERMAPSGELKHAPVRIYLRILSAAMFLLKTFALGAREEDITVSLGLMDQTVDALRKESADDVHLGLRFGELLETLTTRVRMNNNMGHNGDNNHNTNNNNTNTNHSAMDESTTSLPPSSASSAALMPPPGQYFSTNSYFPQMQGGMDDGNGFFPSAGYEDWLALPIDPIMGWSGDGSVTQTQMGPDVGGYDLLELLLGEGGGDM